ncbi:SHOCT domain-containing protein [uncultured Pseudodesulfovibrio sp.]|uniref:SHOCT domain-containing protein n=1 Tax=uncultured Pseudodesulfovibrio sp. TaxID=2035858 RepID=UPI0029C70B92|nr:SHOCT domain-containing protein [uncultured Pseudodesulfovibrio sp.]
MSLLTTSASWCGGPGLWHGGQSWFGGMGFHFGGIIQLLVIGLIIYFTVRLLKRDTAPSSASSSADDILKQRYASGEIDKDTFQSMKEELK